MKLVRVYGRFVGNGSAATVTKGWLEALTHHDVLADTFCLNGEGYRADGGEDAPVAVVTDVRELLSALGNAHKHIYVVLALHTRYLPETIAGLLRSGPISVLSPSRYSDDLLRHAAPDIPSIVVEHGVCAGFRPLTEADRTRLREAPLYRQLHAVGYVNLLHMCESSAARKGTYELLRAFDALCTSRPDYRITLTIVPAQFEHPRARVMTSRLANFHRVRVLPRLNGGAREMRWVYGCFDVIAQPSRAEGFGLVPLEGLVTGVPALVSVQCGHGQWALDARTGNPKDAIETVALGEPGPPFFEPGACPTLDERVMREAIDRTYQSAAVLVRQAERDAEIWHREWSWPLVTAEWMQTIKERYA